MQKRRNSLMPISLDGLSYALACILASLLVPQAERLFRTTHSSPEAMAILPAWLLCFGILVPTLFLWDCYSIPRHWNRVRVLRALVMAHSVVVTLYLIATIPIGTLASARKTILVTSALSVLVLWYWRVVSPDLFGRVDRKRRAVLVGAHTFSLRLLARFARDHSDALEIVGVIDEFKRDIAIENLGLEHFGGRGNLGTVLRTRPVDTLIVLTDPSEYAETIVSLLGEIQTPLEVFVRVQVPLSVAQDMDLWFAQEVPLLKVYSSRTRKGRAWMRGAVDRVLAAVGLILAAPAMLATALAIKLDSNGPVFYRQRRLGEGDRPFEIWKFRSMVSNAEAGRGAVLAEKNDSRVTRVGRVLRALRIDEIPQLINVLRGEMSLIGPRPERPEFQNVYRETIPWYSLRSLCKPGITGLAQVSGDYHTSAQRKLLYDVSYLANVGFWTDVRIALATVVTVLTRRGH